MTLTINKKTYEAGELVAYVEKLEKEYAELKRRNEAVETTLKLHSKFMKSKLTKAKEIIQTLIDSLEVSEGEEIKESKVVKEAEQFLKEK